MPELPDLEVYVEAIRARVLGATLQRVRLASPFLLRTVEPAITEASRRTVRDVRRMGKRIVLALDGDLALAIHLMIAGRLRWSASGARLARRSELAAFDFDAGTIVLTEAGSRHRAALHVVRGEAALDALSAGGLEPLEADAASFAARLRRENRTLKRALTDPSVLSGVGNAYSDEILHRARLSPILLTKKLTDEEAERLRGAAREVLTEWTARLRAEAGAGFPAKVTAFRKEMAVHGKYGERCPACGTTVARIVRGEHETNYCPRCQTGGQVLADRALSRLLGKDWPRSVEEWETRIGPSS